MRGLRYERREPVGSEGYIATIVSLHDDGTVSMSMYDSKDTDHREIDLGPTGRRFPTPEAFGEHFCWLGYLRVTETGDDEEQNEP